MESERKKKFSAVDGQWEENAWHLGIISQWKIRRALMLKAGENTASAGIKSI